MKHTLERFRRFVEEETTLEFNGIMSSYKSCSNEDLDDDKVFTLYYNNCSEESEVCGVYELRNACPGSIYFLEKLFQDPLYPTPDELVLFELEQGFAYDLPKFMKNTKESPNE